MCVCEIEKILLFSSVAIEESILSQQKFLQMV